MTQKFVRLASSHVALMQLDWGTHFEIQGQLPTLNTRISSGTKQATSDFSLSGANWPQEGKSLGKLKVAQGFRRKQQATVCMDRK